MNILFLTAGDLKRTDEGVTSSLASARFRAIIPANELAKYGHAVELAVIPQSGEALEIQRRPDFVVVSKSFSAISEEAVESFKEIGAKIIVDYCDNHFDHPVYGPHFHRLAKLADKVVAATPQMANVLREKTGRRAVVIADPIEGRRNEASFCPKFPAVKLLWFGHPVNYDSLLSIKEDLQKIDGEFSFELRIVSAASERTQSLINQLDCGLKRSKVVFTEWSTASLAEAIQETDIVIIPSLDNSTKNVKSANRLVEAIWGGRLVVANPMPAYRDYAGYAVITDSIAQGVIDAIKHPAPYEANIRLGQQELAHTLLSYHIGLQWLELFDEKARDALPLRLNLGCGDKILPSYVNVDIVESRSGKRPDVICDLNDLIVFNDNSADEVLSVHVVEHFWRWDVEDILKEWLRVLKPGAKMILECPNLYSACAQFVKDPVTFSKEDQRGQRTMWVFYGDPAWKDPYMIHRWGYTPESLAELMRKVGLVDVKQEPAQYKLREPRDMRLVGRKAS